MSFAVAVAAVHGSYLYLVVITVVVDVVIAKVAIVFAVGTIAVITLPRGYYCRYYCGWVTK